MNSNLGGLTSLATDSTALPSQKLAISSIQKRMLTQLEIELLQKDKRDSFDQMLEIMKSQGQIKNLFDTNPLLKTQEQLKKLCEITQPVSSISRLQDQMKNYEANFMGGILGQAKKLHELSQPVSPISRLQEQMKSYEAYPLDNMLGLRKIFESTLEFQGLAQNHTELVANVHINEDGTFSVGNESVSQEEIIEYINDFSINCESYIDAINGFIEQLKNLSNPIIKAVLIYLFIPYFIAIFANVTTSYWEEQWNQFPNLSTREVKNEIISRANENYNSQFLLDHHFVATKILFVRNYESTKAEIIDELYIGKIVKVIDKKRSWCLIEYQDSDTNEFKQGWVFSRYLSKFNR